jgi:outer membrane protein assembly factor BamB
VIARAATIGLISLLAALSAAGLVTSPARGAATAQSSWLMYQGNGAHNAVVARPGFDATWLFEAGAQINGGLAVVGDTLILDTFGHKVIALDVNRGSKRWEATFSNIVMSSPVVADGMVYVGTGSNERMPPKRKAMQHAHYQMNLLWGRKGGDQVVALDLASGKRRWAFETPGEDMPSPAYVGGTLVFANGDAHAYGLNAKTGALLWRTKLTGISTMASANVARNRVLLGVCSGPSYAGSTVAVDPVRGSIAWTASHGDCDSSPTVAGGRIFVSSAPSRRVDYGYEYRGEVAALDASTGATLWTYRSATAGPATMVGSSERAVAGTFADDTFFQSIPTSNELVALDAATGRVKWSLHTVAPSKMSAVIREGRVYIGDTAGLLYTIDERTGKRLDVRLFRAPFATTPPVFVGSTLIIVSGTKVYALPI